MLTQVHPKLPMRNKALTRAFYVDKLGFKELGDTDFEAYLMIEKDQIQIHFFEHKTLDPLENDGQVYIRTNQIEALYAEFNRNRVPIHPNGDLAIKPWGQMEFSVLDPDHNLLTFGQTL